MFTNRNFGLSSNLQEQDEKRCLEIKKSLEALKEAEDEARILSIENLLKNYINPEDYGVESIQELLYEPEGEEARKILCQQCDIPEMTFDFSAKSKTGYPWFDWLLACSGDAGEEVVQLYDQPENEGEYVQIALEILIKAEKGFKGKKFQEFGTKLIQKYLQEEILDSDQQDIIEKFNNKHKTGKIPRKELLALLQNIIKYFKSLRCWITGKPMTLQEALEVDDLLANLEEEYGEETVEFIIDATEKDRKKPYSREAPFIHESKNKGIILNICKEELDKATKAVLKS